MDFSNIGTLIVSGFSAGGYSVYNWIQEFKKIPNVKLFGVPDSGLFLDMPSLYDKYPYRDHFIRSFASVVDVETVPPNHECQEDEEWKCLMLPYLLKYIDVPLFII